MSAGWNVLDDDAYARFSAATRYVESLMVSPDKEGLLPPRASMECYVVVKGGRDAGNRMFPGRLVARRVETDLAGFDFNTTTTTTSTTTTSSTTPPPLWPEGEECWVDPLNLGDLVVGLRYPARVVGYHTDGLPIAVVDSPESTVTTRPPVVTTTTTTAPPCTGKCHWSFVSHAWTKTSSTCATGCKCAAPTWCPDSADSGCTNYETACRKIPADDTPVQCSGVNGNPTTTGPPSPTTVPPFCTTTTVPPSCILGCDFHSSPVGILQLFNGCSTDCPCVAPSFTPSEVCTTKHVPCVPIVPPVPVSCTGFLELICVKIPGRPSQWFQNTGACVFGGDFLEGGYGPGDCFADPPPAPPDPCCGELTRTPCYFHSSPNITSVPPECTTSTTTIPPAGCTGTCLYRTTDGTSWYQYESCVNCDCVGPDRSPSGVCDTAETSCIQTTSTTTTSTTTSPPTYCWKCVDVNGSNEHRICSDSDPSLQDHSPWGHCSNLGSYPSTGDCSNKCSVYCWECDAAQVTGKIHTCSPVNPNGNSVTVGGLGARQVLNCVEFNGPYSSLECPNFCPGNVNTTTSTTSTTTSTTTTSTTSTTTPPPLIGPCGSCSWHWNASVSTWIFSSTNCTCGSCDPPATPGTVDNELETTLCLQYRCYLCDGPAGTGRDCSKEDLSLHPDRGGWDSCTACGGPLYDSSACDDNACETDCP